MERTGARSLLHVFSTFRVGGPQARFAAIANHFGSAYRHTVVAMDGATDAKSLVNGNVDVTFPKVRNNKSKFLSNIFSFRQILRDRHPDFLITYNWGAIEWAFANRPRIAPHLHIEDGFGPEEATGQLRRRIFARRLILSNSTVIVPSRGLECIARDIWKLSPRAIRYIPNGIDFGRFADATKGVSKVPDGVSVIGTVAALRREKNLFRLLEAFRIVRARHPCQLIIAGDGTERESLERKVSELGLEKDVTFTGYRADTERVYAGLDVFALSSDTEQMPTSVLEAMAAGLPIASTDVGDVRAMVARENVPFVVSKDAATLASALLALLQDVGLRKRVGAANQAVARRDFSQDKMFAAYETLFLGKGAQPAE